MVHHNALHLLRIRDYQMTRNLHYRQGHDQYHLDLMSLLLMKNDLWTSADLHRAEQEQEECTLTYSYTSPQLNHFHSFSVQPAPSDTLALSNCLIVNPNDFKDGEHVLVKGEFPLTVKYVSRPIPSLRSNVNAYTIRYDDTHRLPPGAVGASAVQRQWIGLSATSDSVTVVALPAHPHPSAPPFLENLTLEVGFLQRNYDPGVEFSADDMSATFVRGYAGVVFSIGQIIVFEYHGVNLRCVVKSVSVLELAAEQRGGGGPQRMDSGIVMEKTDVAFMKEQSSKIRIKSSAKRAAPNAIVAPNFKFEDMGIGGLDQEFSAIFRRAFASRVFPPGLVEKLGIQHVKGAFLQNPNNPEKIIVLTVLLQVYYYMGLREQGRLSWRARSAKCSMRASRRSSMVPKS